MNVSVLGAGAWGTAFAATLAERHRVRLWARDAAQAAAMREARCNRRYLPEVVLPDALVIDEDFGTALAAAELVVIAVPMAGLQATLSRLPIAFDAPSAPPVLWLSKGFEEASGWLGHELAQAVRPQLRVGVLSGPSFALEVARRQPTALVAASIDGEVGAAAIRALHSDSLRVYVSSDPIGVEVGGAIKNVLAVATGIADGMPRADRDGAAMPAGLGLNARAALITRGLAEMTRFGVALGARAETFMGLSGLGDLVLTATGDLSRNRRVGIRLAQGDSLKQILGELGHVAEGVRSAATALRRARALGVDMPITAAVVAVIEGRLTAAQALERLMSRDARAEG